MKKAEDDSGLSRWSKLRIINECTLALLDLGAETIRHKTDTETL